MAELRKRPIEQPLPRMVGHGVNYVDYYNMCKRLEGGEDYVLVCEEIGDKAHDYAEKSVVAFSYSKLKRIEGKQ